MIITREEQNKLLTQYTKDYVPFKQVEGFIHGMEAIMELVDEKLKEQK